MTSKLLFTVSFRCMLKNGYVSDLSTGKQVLSFPTRFTALEDPKVDDLKLATTQKKAI